MMWYYWSAGIGICLILKYGSILETFRQKTSQVFPPLAKLYKCCLCMGFWVGLLLVPFLYNIEGYGLESFLFPFSVSFWGFLFDSIITVIHTVNNYLSSESESSSDSSSESSSPNK